MAKKNGGYWGKKTMACDDEARALLEKRYIENNPACWGPGKYTAVLWLLGRIIQDTGWKETKPPPMERKLLKEIAEYEVDKRDKRMGQGKYLPLPCAGD